MKYAKDKSKKNVKYPLRKELESYEKQGVELWLDGQPSTPKSICRACKIAEDGTYMRDYIRNRKGEIKHLDFTSIKQVEKKEL